MIVKTKLAAELNLQEVSTSDSICVHRRTDRFVEYLILVQ